MYKLPNDFDETLLQDCYLEMVSFGPSVVKLDFSRPQFSPGKSYAVTFCIEGGLSFSLERDEEKTKFTLPSGCAPLVGFLLHDVASVTRVGSASLRISFGAAGTLFIDADDEVQFESYSIYLSNGDIIVV